MNHDYKIEYENIVLRPLAKDDIEHLRVWRNDSKNTRYLRKIPYITEEMQTEWYERYLRNDDEICFAIIENADLKRMVGSLSLYEFMDDSCFLGKILIGDIEAHERKIGMNASIAASNIAFEELGIETVYLKVYADNLAALKVYKDAGFTIGNEFKTEGGRKEYLMLKRRI